MPCLAPLKGWRAADGTLKFTRTTSELMTVACGQCGGCRQRKKLEWAIRLTHEALCHEERCFLTLTYAPQVAGQQFVSSLPYEDVQQFMSNLRKHCRRKLKKPPLRFFCSGEYGAAGPGVHPHWHILLYGHEFNEDKELLKWKGTNGELSLFTSPTLERLWPWGFSSFGSLTPASAAYTAGYIQKKLTGKLSSEYVECVYDPRDGEYFSVRPEFATMSMRPGLGRAYYEQFGEADFETGHSSFNGKKTVIPKRYWQWLQAEDPIAYDHYREDYDARMEEYLASQPVLTERRMRDIEECIRLRVKNWKGELH